MMITTENALRERIAELEEEVRQLREQLAPRVDWTFVGVSATQSRILAVLHAAAPYTAAYERFESVVEGRGALSSHIRTMRERLRPLGVKIFNRSRDGYALLLADKKALDVARAAHEAGIPLTRAK